MDPIIGGDNAVDAPAGGAGWRDPAREDPRLGAVSHLAVAAQRYRFYPPGSPLCLEAVADCRRALDVLPGGTLDLEVSPGGILVEGEPVSGTSMIRDLAERLFRADLDRVSLQSEASPTEIASFCTALAEAERHRDDGTNLEDTLIELGVLNIQIRTVERVEVLHADLLDANRLGQVAADRAARPAGPTGPGRIQRQGWIRAEPECAEQKLDMHDLAFLVADPFELALLIDSIAERGGPDERRPDRARTLTDRIGDLIQLYGALGPGTAAARFDALASAFDELDEACRRELLLERLLPELLESGRCRELLVRLSDDELVAALEELATASIGGIGLVRLALDRLDPEPARRAGLLARLASLADEGEATSPSAAIGLGATGPRAQSLSEYAALDLAVDHEASLELQRIRRSLVAANPLDTRLRTIADLVRLARNPERVAGLLNTAAGLMKDLAGAAPADLVPWVGQWRGIAEELAEPRPDVTAAIERLLGGLVDAEFLRAHADRLAEDEDLGAFARAFGAAGASAFVEALEIEDDRGRRRKLLDFLCANADAFAPGLAPHAVDARWTVRRNVARALGFAGAGSEEALTGLVADPERRVVREALLALARVGTARAADAVIAALVGDDAEAAELAEESMRVFPRAEARAKARALLSDTAFCVRRPGLARDLLRRFVQRDPEGGEALKSLLALRRYVWRPAAASLGWEAWRIVRRRGRS